MKWPGYVMLGADSYCAAQGERNTTTSPKIWRNVRWLVGAAGCGAWFATVRNAVFRDGDPLDWLPAALVRSGKKLGANYPDVTSDPDSPLRGCALLARGSRLHYFDDALNVVELDGDAAIGSGADAARAILFGLDDEPIVRLERALVAAAHVRSDVSPPFRWLSTNGKGGAF